MSSIKDRIAHFIVSEGAGLTALGIGEALAKNFPEATEADRRAGAKGALQILRLATENATADAEAYAALIRRRGGSLMQIVVDGHKSAWQALRDAKMFGQANVGRLEQMEQLALRVLLAHIPDSPSEVGILEAHLDWWVVEEAGRRESEPEPFALHASIAFAKAMGGPA